MITRRHWKVGTLLNCVAIECVFSMLYLGVAPIKKNFYIEDSVVASMTQIEVEQFRYVDEITGLYQW